MSCVKDSLNVLVSFLCISFICVAFLVFFAIYQLRFVDFGHWKGMQHFWDGFKERRHKESVWLRQSILSGEEGNLMPLLAGIKCCRERERKCASQKIFVVSYCFDFFIFIFGCSCLYFITCFCLFLFCVALMF